MDTLTQNTPRTEVETFNASTPEQIKSTGGQFPMPYEIVVNAEFARGLEIELNACRACLQNWIKHNQRPIPTSRDEQESDGESFSDVWFETQRILNSNPQQL